MARRDARARRPGTCVGAADRRRALAESAVKGAPAVPRQSDTRRQTHDRRPSARATAAPRRSRSGGIAAATLVPSQPRREPVPKTNFFVARTMRIARAAARRRLVAGRELLRGAAKTRVGDTTSDGAPWSAPRCLDGPARGARCATLPRGGSGGMATATRQQSSPWRRRGDASRRRSRATLDFHARVRACEVATPNLPTPSPSLTSPRRLGRAAEFANAQPTFTMLRSARLLSSPNGARADGGGGGRAPGFAMAADLPQARRRCSQLAAPPTCARHKQAKLARRRLRRKTSAWAEGPCEMTDMHDWWCDGDGKSNWEGVTARAAATRTCAASGDHALKHEEPARASLLLRRRRAARCGGSTRRGAIATPRRTATASRSRASTSSGPKFREQFEPKSALRSVLRCDP